ncbi:MAG: class I SAM-dependent methyltransferase [Candidatus Dormibacteria bacterium]
MTTEKHQRHLVVDDAQNPDPAFAELYAQLPDAEGLEPWKGWALAARGEVLYLGIGAGRLAAPLAAAGIGLFGVDSHPGMLERLARRLPQVPVRLSRIEDLDLGRRFRLVIAPSSILNTDERLQGAARHLDVAGRLGIELTNPHWLTTGASPGVRVLDVRGREAEIELDYQLPGGRTVTQWSRFPLIWPEEVEPWLERNGLALRLLLGHPEEDLESSPTFFVLAAPTA